jgi:DNA-binding Lrp family transcriptional regulator
MIVTWVELTTGTPVGSLIDLMPGRPIIVVGSRYGHGFIVSSARRQPIHLLGAVPVAIIEGMSSATAAYEGSAAAGLDAMSKSIIEQLHAEGNLDSVVERLNGMDEVDYVVTAGSFDILAEVVCEDDDHLLNLLNHEIRVIPGVRSTESFVYLKLSKQTYQWGTR